MVVANGQEAKFRPIPSGVLALVVGAAILTILSGLSALVGWAYGITILKDWIGSGITIKANASLALTLAGCGLLASAFGSKGRPAQRVFATLVFLIAFSTFLQNLFDLDFGIDTLFFQEAPGEPGTSAPGRMGMPGSTSLTLLAVSHWLASTVPGWRRVASNLAVFVTFIALYSFVGYLYGASGLYSLPKWTGVAFQTSLILIVLSIGTTASIPEQGLAASILRPDAGGVVLRRLVIPIISLPIALGWLLILGQRAGLYNDSFGIAVFVLAIVFTILSLTVWCANGIGSLAEAEKASREALVQANQELERRVAARTSELVTKVSDLEGFCYSVSHDMRAPLRAIIGNAHIVMEEESDQLSEEGATRLKSLAGAAKKMATLIDDLLRYARLGEEPPIVKECDFTELCIRVADEVRHDRSDRSDRDAAISVEPNLIVDCDPRLFGLVMHNLIENSFKYARRNAPVRVEIGLDEEGWLFVRDDGIGFDMRYANRIFMPFERLHRDVDYPGTGIGLANVQRIVERHGGMIRAESSPGKGATFFISLPGTRRRVVEEAPQERGGETIGSAS